MRVGNFVIRLIMFLVGIPLLVASVLAVPEPNHPLYLALAMVAAFLGAREAAVLFDLDGRGHRRRMIGASLLGPAVPVATVLEIFGLISESMTLGVLVLAFGIVLTAHIGRKDDEGIRRIVPSIAGHALVILYPGLLLSYSMRLVALPQSGALILVYFASVFFNDTMAYIIGRLFGHRTEGVVAISPNKSAVGFIGGLVTSPVVILVAELLIPGLFPGAIGQRIVFGFAIGIGVIVGDLVESGFKRSAAVKDSGNVVPGRGGMLDSIDSPIFVAPLFYYLYLILFL